MKGINFSLKILAPSILCAIVIISTKMDLDYYPLSFGLIIGLVNWNYHRNNSYFGVILSLVISYASFIISYASTGLLAEMLKPLLGEDKAGIIALTIFPFVIAPLLVFFSYKLVFNYKIKTKFSKIILISSIILLVTMFYVHYNYSEYGRDQQEFNAFLNPYTLWQIIVALALQLLLHQKSLVKKHVD